MKYRKTKEEMLEDIAFLRRRLDEIEAAIKIGENPFLLYSYLISYTKEAMGLYEKNI